MNDGPSLGTSKSDPRCWNCREHLRKAETRRKAKHLSGYEQRSRRDQSYGSLSAELIPVLFKSFSLSSFESSTQKKPTVVGEIRLWVCSLTKPYLTES